MSFQQGLSGLAASSASLDVIGNNVANANTSAPRRRAPSSPTSTRTRCGGTSNAIGIGVKVAAVAQQFTQGNDHLDRQPARRRHQRHGFFEVSDKSGAVSYTRNGQFKTDTQGFIVNDQGQQPDGLPGQCRRHRHSWRSGTAADAHRRPRPRR